MTASGESGERRYIRAARARLSAHRLGRILGRATGLEEVGCAIVRAMARAVDARLASLVVASPDDQSLSIVATFGYPLALVEHLRIVPGIGILGTVYQKRAPMRVEDVSALTGARRRRYKTGSFIAIPLRAGSHVLGVVSVADRNDGRPFSRDDLSMLCLLAPPAVLALAREHARQQADAFAHAAAIDPVSGLFNRRYFHVRIEEELQRARRHHLPVALLMIDIDDFKTINDNFGHLAGDVVIKDIAEILKRSVRVFDICTRFGGEEFAIVMPDSDADDAVSSAERIRQRIEGYQSLDLGGMRITASIGVAVSTEEMTVRELIAHADQALYSAKQAGKNQVRTLTPTDAGH
jgi:diguanylate cyclase (GGDEF)-like protein